MLVRLKRRGVPRSLFIVSLPSIGLTRRNCNSFWTCFYTHIIFKTAASGRASYILLNP